jgi:hypothetical protein
MEVTVYGHAFRFLPSANGTLAPAEIGGNLFPGIETVALVHALSHHATTVPKTATPRNVGH